MLIVENLYKSYGKNKVLNGVNLHVKKGEVLVVVGPSGGGKTTFLRSINYLEKCDTGSISLNGNYLLSNGRYSNKNAIKELRTEIGLVFQNFNLFPHLSVLENI
ncbi:MAG: ATP-binding cassette domain-containing protein, partial [Niameybacter sp.]